ncbi:hypothetical protein [Alicyclobacillus sacchari]|uniref:hypothetical protein n=1 Tax=Alicyclobacillus sacchari TaxID=392010 RepID=UPI0024E16F68|nr:hypothetical protein [Alicyclobacillus sacchari]
MNSAPGGQVVHLDHGGYLPWPSVSRGLRMAVGVLNGCAGTLFAATLAWDHKSATPAVFFAWLACTAASLATATLMSKLRPPVSLLIGLTAAAVLSAVPFVTIRAGAGWMAATILSALLAAGLNLTYVFEGDAVHAARNLRWITGISAFGVIFYALVQAREYGTARHARSRLLWFSPLAWSSPRWRSSAEPRRRRHSFRNTRSCMRRWHLSNFRAHSSICVLWCVTG